MSNRPHCQQYHDLKAAEPATYNFGEDELNALGYQLIRTNKFKAAILILRLNVEAYPHSSKPTTASRRLA